MRKIRLDVDALAVESFSPAERQGAPDGTVRAHQDAGAAPDVPTLNTGYHGCYACPATVVATCLACAGDTLLCPDTAAGG